MEENSGIHINGFYYQDVDAGVIAQREEKAIEYLKRIINEINFQFRVNRLLMLDSYHESNFELIGFRCSYFYYFTS